MENDEKHRNTWKMRNAHYRSWNKAINTEKHGK